MSESLIIPFTREELSGLEGEPEDFTIGQVPLALEILKRHLQFFNVLGEAEVVAGSEELEALDAVFGDDFEGFEMVREFYDIFSGKHEIHPGDLMEGHGLLPEDVEQAIIEAVISDEVLDNSVYESDDALEGISFNRLWELICDRRIEDRGLFLEYGNPKSDYPFARSIKNDLELRIVEHPKTHVLYVHCNDEERGDFMNFLEKALSVVDFSCETELGPFQFLFVKVPEKNYYEIQIKNSPTYGDRDADPAKVHRKMSEVDTGTAIICLSNPEQIDYVEKAEGIAKMWADLTCGYIKTGEFSNP
ncbi:MAG: hypothetical protein ABII07_00155 [Patescibacteria group bacterium]